MNRKYSNIMFGNYVVYAKENDKEVIPLAPPDWEARAKRRYVVNTAFLPRHVKAILNDPRLESTLYILSKLTITGQNNTTIQFVIIKNELFLDPFFQGISENIFFNSYCFIPDLGLSPRSLAAIELKINMLGGRVIKNNFSDIDIMICPRTPTRKSMTQLMDEAGIDHLRNIINIATLNQIFRRHFTSYPIHAE